jgi:hypothetical protein
MCSPTSPGSTSFNLCTWHTPRGIKGFSYRWVKNDIPDAADLAATVTSAVPRQGAITQCRGLDRVPPTQPRSSKSKPDGPSTTS